MSIIRKEGNFLTDGRWWEKKLNLRYTTNGFNILFQHAHKEQAQKYYFVTYNIKDVKNILNKLEKKETHIFVNSKFLQTIELLKNKYPSIHFYHNPIIHLKLYMNDCGKIVFGSQNFNGDGNGNSWIEGMWEIHDKEYFELLYNHKIKPLMLSSQEVFVNNTERIIIKNSGKEPKGEWMKMVVKKLKTSELAKEFRIKCCRKCGGVLKIDDDMGYLSCLNCDWYGNIVSITEEWVKEIKEKEKKNNV
jgi:hypothetical protein